MVIVLMPVCLRCLDIVCDDKIVKQNQLEYYHDNCYLELLKIRERKNKLFEVSDDFLIIDPSENSTALNNLNNSIENFLDLSSNDKILNCKTTNTIFKSDFAVDIAGNLVKLDKNYIINQENKIN
jgi:hypothetical protein